MKRKKSQRSSDSSMARRVAGPVVSAMLVFYLGFHTVSGDNGLIALFEENKKQEMLSQRLQKVSSERQSLEFKTSLLSDTSLDLDLLDEQARKMLGYVGKNEVVIFLEN